MIDELTNKTNYLINKLASDDSEEALKSLYQLYFHKLVRFIYMYVQSYGVIEEIISDVFLSIWQNRKELVHIQNFNAYLLTIARNKAVSHYRKEEKHLYSSYELPIVDLYHHTDTTPEDNYIDREMITRLNKAVSDLPPQCRMAFKLVREDKMKYKEAAVLLNISIKTLEAHITKATKLLRKVFDEKK